MLIEVSNKLWNDLLLVVSSITHWKEVISQWKVIIFSFYLDMYNVLYNLCVHYIGCNGEYDAMSG